jgi:hypothetical protein
MNGKSAKISGPRPLPSTFFSLLHSTIRRFIVWTNEELREMEADYSGGQSSPWPVAPRGRKEGRKVENLELFFSMSKTGLPMNNYLERIIAQGGKEIQSICKVSRCRTWREHERCWLLSCSVCFPPMVIFKDMRVLVSHKQNSSAGSTIKMRVQFH